jgi:hypothetical protein
MLSAVWLFNLFFGLVWFGFLGGWVALGFELGTLWLEQSLRSILLWLFWR